MNDTDRILVQVKGLDQIQLHPPAQGSTALADALSALAPQAYGQLWVPRAALVPGALLALPDGVTVRVLRVIWASSASGHLANPVATIQVEPENLP